MDCFMSRKDYDKRKGLTDYYYFLGGLTDEEIELIKSISENYTVEEGTTGKALHPNYRNSKIRWLPKDNKTEWLYKKLGALAKQANNDYWGFDIVGFGEYLQYGEYNSNVSGHYDWHLDLGQHSCWRKISMSVQLSDPDTYKGGDLQLYTKKDIISVPRKKGTILFFPSYLLHRVTPVTEGVRYSLVTWITGPPLR